jgi:phosphoglycerol transferase MdoB-like AlkP superfamily enzyme
MSKVYNFNDYDKNLSLKVSHELWLIILYLLHPFILLLSTVRMGRGGSGVTGVDGLKNLVYPDDFSLVLAILATMPTLLFVFAWTRRKPGAPALVQRLWAKGATLLAAAAALYIVVVFVPLLTRAVASIHPVGWAQVAISIFIIVDLFKSQRIKDTFADFPVAK